MTLGNLLTSLGYGLHAKRAGRWWDWTEVMQVKQRARPWHRGAPGGAQSAARVGRVDRTGPGGRPRADRAPSGSPETPRSGPTPLRRSCFPRLGVQTLEAGRSGSPAASSTPGPPSPWPRYLAACSARSVSRANWSVPKKSTRQGGFSRTRAPRPSSPPEDPLRPSRVRH